MKSFFSKAMPIVGAIVTLSGFLNILGIKIPKLVDLQFLLLNNVPYKIFLPIASVLIGILLLVTFIIMQKYKVIKINFKKEIEKNEIPKPLDNLFEACDYKWMVKYYNGQIIDIRGLPYCMVHEMQLTTGPAFNLVGYKCPECNQTISKQKLDSIFGTAQSILEKRIRDMVKQ